MKKVMSLILAVIIIFSVMTPALALTCPRVRIQYPSIYIHGNSGSIIDEEGTQVYDFDVSTDRILEICKIVLPKLAKGIATQNFEEYYDSFEDEIAKLYDRCSLDKEGLPKYGTTIEQWCKDKVASDMTTNRYNNGFGIGDYVFYCDWRLDPLYNADLLDEYIDAVRNATGLDKVCLVSDCLGSVNILAYMGKYGHDKLYGVGMLDPVAFGCELVEDTFSGHINFDPDAIERFVNDKFIENEISADFATVLELVRTSVELANETGVLDGVTDLFMKKIYNKFKDELVPRLSLASYASWLSYWGLISPARYKETKNLIFGKPGSERYNEYSTFIKKLDEYDRVVRQRIPEILTSAKNDGVKLAIVAKYGVQFPCVLESADRQCDVWVSLKYATLGATCAPIGETLSDEYIAQRKACGFGKYISPDRIVDMSTCLFPDNTWIIKNRVHNQAGLDNDFILYMLAEDNITVDNSFAPQFTVYVDETKTSEAMTTENCHTESWYVEPQESKGFFGDTFAKIKAFFEKVSEWFRLVFELLGSINK